MTAVVIDLSDDEALDVEISHSLTPICAREDLDAELAARLQRKEEIKMVASLRREDEIVSCRTLDSLGISNSALINAASDAALARRLQREEEELASNRKIENLNAACKKPRLSSQYDCFETKPISPEVVSIIAEPAIACSDAVALIRDCFRNAKDLSRSKVFLCGSTPFYFQHRQRGRRESSSFALARSSSSNADSSTNPTDNWSCGYRNIQMLIGHLQLRVGGKEVCHSKLFDGKVPDVRTLQLELERLWASGYDPEGCQQLGGVCGTKKWIGTSEACVLLRGQAVRCNIVSFRGDTSNASESAISAAEAVVERVFKHFRNVSNSDGSSELVVTSQPPLYLQHDGHSRTIVGVQRRQEAAGKHTDFLLVLDPGLGLHGFEDFKDSACRGHGWERFVKRSLAPLKKKGEYELLIVEPDVPISAGNMASSRCIRKFV